MNRRRTGATVILLLAFFVAMQACSKVDDTLGNSFIPEDQQMIVKMDTIDGIKAYLTLCDSFPTSKLDSCYLGSYKTPSFGVTTGGFAFQYCFTSFTPDSTYRFGIAPEVDSLILNLASDGFVGDVNTPQTFNIYELKERIYRDSVYYADFKAEDYIESEPLFTFTYSGREDMKLILTGPKADALAERLMDTTGRVYEVDSLFIQRFKGLYIAPAASSATNASMISISPQSSGLSLYIHNYTSEDRTDIKDTIAVIYSTFSDRAGNRLATINKFSHDYTGTSINTAAINDTLSTSTPQAVTYVQGRAGLLTYLRFTEEFVADLKAKLQAPYKSMVVNRAKIVFNMQEKSIPNMDWAFSRLGMFTVFSKLTPIVDYPYKVEMDANNPVNLPYGGYFSRTHGQYEMDISSFIQEIINSNNTGSRTMTLGPAVTELYGYQEVALNTIPDATHPDPLRIVLTYTLVK